MNIEYSEFLLMKIDQMIENDIDNSFSSFGINKPQSMSFTYIVDNQTNFKDEQDNNYFLNAEIIYDLQ